jgi:protein-S-isoprenylcysteine O-methyltransferase Ste14
MRTLFTAIRTTVFATLFVGLWGWIAFQLHRFDSSLGGPLPSWTELPGVAFMTFGAALALACIIWLVVRGHGTPAPFDPPRDLVAAGPYRWMRNPMYVGGAATLLGLALVLRSPAILLFVPVWWLLAHLLVLFYEEPTLRRNFGASFEEYCRRVPRWWPRRPHFAAH